MHKLPATLGGLHICGAARPVVPHCRPLSRRKQQLLFVLGVATRAQPDNLGRPLKKLRLRDPADTSAASASTSTSPSLGNDRIEGVATDSARSKRSALSQTAVQYNTRGVDVDFDLLNLKIDPDPDPEGADKAAEPEAADDWQPGGDRRSDAYCTVHL
eukprot:TRINITY_DN9142_c0_g1_i1.p2 TRINITY_DN9142_c0_g1~~TRINITY_DN9142_c0_g1_i1.p2  ORF type:complete len:158 (-),score=32.45 TRINITY_DN9142_c0_g1_i1:6-479(-)